MTSVSAQRRDYVGMLAPSTADGWVVDSHVRWLLRRGALDASSTVDLLDTWVASGATTGRARQPRDYSLRHATVRDRHARDSCRWVDSGGPVLSGAPAAARLALSEPAVALAEQVNDVPLLVRSLRNYIDDLVALRSETWPGGPRRAAGEVGTTSGSGQARWWADLLDIASNCEKETRQRPWPPRPPHTPAGIACPRPCVTMHCGNTCLSACSSWAS